MSRKVDLKDLPTPPAGVAQVIRAANDPSRSLGDVARVIEREPSLTVHLLRLANSAAFSPGREVRSVGQATVLLGARVIRNIAVAHAVMALYRRVDLGDFDATQFWEDSLRRACAALVLARRTGWEDPSEAFTVGLVQDIGVLVLAMLGHGDVMQRLRTLPGPDRLRRETDLVGRNHVEVFVSLGLEWGLPREIVDAVAFHHIDPPKDALPRTVRLAQIARAADLLADIPQTFAAGDTLTQAAARLLELGEVHQLRLDSLLKDVADEMVVQSRDLEIRISNQPSFDTLMAGASEALLRLSSSYEKLTRRLEELVQEKDELARQLETRNEELKRLARTDPLTGALNRRAFAEILTTMLATLDKPGARAVSVLMVDVDHFKQINDSHGHLVGDDVLVELASRLRWVVGGDDVVARMGGEEFAIVLKGCDDAAGMQAADRLRHALRQEPVQCRNGLTVSVRVSVGGVTLRKSTRIEDVLRAADTALYRAKADGRDQARWAGH